MLLIPEFHVVFLNARHAAIFPLQTVLIRSFKSPRRGQERELGRCIRNRTTACSENDPQYTRVLILPANDRRPCMQLT